MIVSGDKKSILFLCQFFYPEKVSSATLPFDTAISLANAGYHVGALCGYPKEYLIEMENVPMEETIHGILIKRIKYRTFSRKSFIGRLINYFSFTAKCYLNKKVIKNYDYVIVYSNPPILPYVTYKAHKKYGTKIIFVSYDIYPEIAIQSKSIGNNSIMTKVMNFINKKFFSVVDKVVALSNDMKKYIVEHRSISENKVFVIPNWFNEEKERIKKIGRNDTFVVSYFGNMGTCQDVETILDAANFLKSHKNIKFVFGGHGNKVQTIESFIKNNGLNNIDIMPFLTGDKYNDAMNATSCFVLSLIPNISNLCFPSKYYSYLYYGRPIIAVMEKCDLSNEVEDNGIGYRVDNNNGKLLAETILRLSKVPTEEYDDMCNRCVSVYNNKYTKKKMIERYIDLIES